MQVSCPVSTQSAMTLVEPRTGLTTVGDKTFVLWNYVMEKLTLLFIKLLRLLQEIITYFRVIIISLFKLHYAVTFRILYHVVAFENVTSSCNIVLLQHNVTL